MTAPNQEQLKALEQTRQRLIQLTHSLGSLIGSLNQSDPLPSWSSLQSQASIISNNLLNVSSILREYQPLFSSLVAYPAPSYPGKTQANTLEQLLRTKLDPRVNDWVSHGRAVGANVSGLSGAQNQEGGKSLLSEQELDELWAWAPLEANREARRRNWGGNFTLEEMEMGVENIVTGLRRELEVDEEDEDEEESEEEVDGMQEVAPGLAQGAVDGGRGEVAAPEKPAMPGLGLDEIMRFMTTGMAQKGR